MDNISFKQANHVVRIRRLALLGTALAAIIGNPALAQDTQLDSTSVSYRYDGAGRLVGVIDPDPDNDGPLRYPAVRTYFDPVGLPVRVETGELSTWQSAGIAPANWTGFTILKTEQYHYDTRNLKVRTEVLGADGIVTEVMQMNYDRVGQQGCSAIRMNPAVFNALPASACDQGTEGAEGKDRITRKYYDSAGQLQQIRRGVGTSLEQAYVTYSYTSNGKQENVVDANGNRARLEYDGFDRLRRWYFPSTSRPTAFNDTTAANALASAGAFNAADYEEYGYDPNGNRESLRKRDGQVLSFTFDALNRVTRKAGASTEAIDYTYDLLGLQLSAVYSVAGEGVSATYDGFGRVQTATSTMAGYSRQLSYGYDRNGNRTRVTHPDGNSAIYKYDKVNRPDCILRSLDAECTAAPASNLLADYSYNNRGLPQAMNGAVSTSLGYDTIGRLTSLSNNLPAAAWNNSWSFNYNPAAQIKSNTQTNDQFAWTAHVNVDRGYVTNGLNQYVAAGPAAFCYDGNGNLTADGGSVYRYDSENRLIEKRVQAVSNTNCAALSYSGTLQASLRYDPMGRLAKVTSENGGATTFLHDGDALVAEYDGANMVRRYVHGGDAKQDDPIIWYEGVGFNQINERHMRSNWQGSIVLVTDSTGANVVAVNRYDEYGVPNCPLIGGVPDCLAPGANQGRFQYTGQAWIGELGMYYYKARIYSPTLGRFLQTDPVGYEDNINLYSYVENDPINKVDPDGKEAACVTLNRPCVGPDANFYDLYRFLFGGVEDAIRNPTPFNLFIAAIDLSPGRLFRWAGKGATFVFRGNVSRVIAPGAYKLLGGGISASPALKQATIEAGRLLRAGQGRVIARGSNFRDAPYFASRYGGNVDDWEKVASRTIGQTPEGLKIELHAVRYRPTGQIYDLKYKVQ